MNVAVGRILDLPCHKPPPTLYECPVCPGLRRRIEELERAVRKHKESWEMSRAITGDVKANEELWGVIGL